MAPIQKKWVPQRLRRCEYALVAISLDATSAKIPFFENGVIQCIRAIILIVD